MNKHVVIVAAAMALAALAGCEAEADRQKTQQQIAPPPYTKPIPRITKGDKLKPIDWEKKQEAPK